MAAGDSKEAIAKKKQPLDRCESKGVQTVFHFFLASSAIAVCVADWCEDRRVSFPYRVVLLLAKMAATLISSFNVQQPFESGHKFSMPARTTII